MKRLNILKLPENPRFTNKTILLFILPIFLEQLLINLMGFADSLMVARAPNGEIAMAGVELVKRIDLLIKQIVVALAAGGSIVASQYMGAGDRKKAGIAMKNCYYVLIVLMLLVSAIMLVLKSPVLDTLYPVIEARVRRQALSYFSVTLLSYPLMTLYYTGSACFRAIGNSRMTMVASVGMMAMNLGLKYMFIFIMNMGVMGAGLSSLIAYGVVGAILLALLHRRKNPIYIDNIFKVHLVFKIMRSIIGLGVPNGIENGLFQLGSLILQGLVASLGTEAIEANGLVHNVIVLVFPMLSAFTLAVITFVGQCMGAGKPEEAKFYIKHILKLEYLVVAVNVIAILPLIRPVAMIFGLSESVTQTGVFLTTLYAVCSLFLYPQSFMLANALRAAGDVRFVMTVSVTLMFAFRIGLAYLLVYQFHMGVEAIWYAMHVDWVVRGSIYLFRLKGTRWQRHKIVD